MSSDHRAYHFFTCRLADPNSHVLTDNITLLRAATRATMDRYPFEVVAAVILPAQLHMIWRLPPRDTATGRRWACLKAYVSRRLPDPLGRTAAQKRTGQKGLWHSRSIDYPLTDATSIETHIRLIHSAPVQAGLVTRASDWPYSSIHRRRDAIQPAA